MNGGFLQCIWSALAGGQYYWQKLDFAELNPLYVPRCQAIDKIQPFVVSFPESESSIPTTL